MSHRNRLSNEEPHHLYGIYDKLEDDVFKYGISADPIEADGLSKRVRDQLRILNSAVNWMRFFARILKVDIAGRKRAKEVENKEIEDYVRKNGRRPRGNPPIGRKRKHD